MSTWRNSTYVTGTNPTDVNAWDSYYKLDDIFNVAKTKSTNWTLDQLNALNDVNFNNLSWNKTLNDRGYQAWNNSFNTLGLNEYFGYSDDIDDFMGPTTYNRKLLLDKFRNTYSSQDKALNISGGQKVFFNTATGKWELFSDSPVGGNKEVNSVDGAKKSPEVTPSTLKPLTFNTPTTTSEKERFFGWIPHLSNYFSNLRATNQNLRLAKQLNPPLQTAALKQDTVTSDYALEQAYADNAAKMRSLGNKNLTSNAELNRQQKFAYDSKASELEEKSALAKSQKYNQEIQQGQDTAYGNNKALTDTTNINKKIIFGAEEYKTQAEQTANLKKADALNNLVSGVWNDSTQFRQTQSLNDAHQKDREFKLDTLQQKQDLINKFNQDFSDYTTSTEYEQWRNFVNNPVNQSLVTPPVNAGEFDNWLKEQWLTNEHAKKFREQWEKRKNDVQTSTQQSIDNLNLRYQMGADQPLYFTGQPDLWPFGNKKHSSPAFQKKGGKVDRLSDYLKIVQKEQSDYRKNNQRARATELRKLEKELEQINQKQVLLLREIFG